MNVRKVSGSEAILEPDERFEENSEVRLQLELKGGTTTDVSAYVLSSDARGVVLQWSHRSPKGADELDETLRGYAARARARAAAHAAKSAKVESSPEGGDNTTAPLTDVSRLQKKAGKITNVIKVGGKLDVSASILNEAKTVRSAELASRLDTVQVLNMSTIKELIKKAVNDAIAMMGPTLHEAERKRLMDQAEVAFREQFRAFQAEKAGLQAQAQNLQEQLDKAQKVLDDERARVISANQFTVSDAGIEELETKFSRMLERVVQSGKVAPEVEQDMRSVISKLLDDERDKISEQARQAQNDAILLLEKKVNRLATNLEQTVKERDSAKRRAQALEATGGAVRGNVYEAGLDDEDPEHDRKLDLLKELVEFNRSIRKELGIEKKAAPGGSADANANASASAASPTPAPAATEPSEAPPASDDEAPGPPAAEPEHAASAFDDEEETSLVMPSEDEESVEARDVTTPAASDEIAARADGPQDDSAELESPAVPVLAHAEDGEEVDPDDCVWEPPGAKAPAGNTAEFKRLG